MKILGRTQPSSLYTIARGRRRRGNKRSCLWRLLGNFALNPDCSQGVKMILGNKDKCLGGVCYSTLSQQAARNFDKTRKPQLELVLTSQKLVQSLKYCVPWGFINLSRIIEKGRGGLTQLKNVLTCTWRDAGGRRRGISWPQRRVSARIWPAPAPWPRTRAWTPALPWTTCISGRSGDCEKDDSRKSIKFMIL